MSKLINWFSEGRSSGKYTLPFVILLLAVTVLASAANLLLPQDSALYVSTYSITLLGKYLCYAMLALAVDIIWGYCGILSLGHGAFFALGGYAMGMYLMRQIGDRGVYGHPILPDFMVFLDWQELPWFWHGMDQFWFAMIMAVLVPGLLAFVFGWLAFRSRVTGVYLSIMTQALTYALLLAFFRNEMGFGGNNGLTDFKEILGFDLQSDSTRVSLFIITAVILAVVLMLSQRILSSRLGKVTLAVRDAEARTRFIGYRTERYKVWLRTNSISCSTTITVRSPANDVSSSAVRSVSCAVIPATGSSINNKRGSDTNNMPISSHCF